MGGAFIAPATLVDDWQRRTLQPSLPDTDRIQTFAICPQYMLGPRCRSRAKWGRDRMTPDSDSTHARVVCAIERPHDLALIARTFNSSHAADQLGGAAPARHRRPRRRRRIAIVRAGCPPKFPLASGTSWAHSAAMPRVHPFTFNVEPDPLREARYRWTVCEGTQIRLRSPRSYSTKEEAVSEATKVAERLSSGEPNSGSS